jgi:methyl-accepting chemotaxis protein
MAAGRGTSRDEDGVKPILVPGTEIERIAEGEADPRRRIDLVRKDEMSAGAEDVNRSATAVSDLAERMGSSIQGMEASTGKFRV